MNSSLLKKITPHLIAAGIFLLIAIVYCQPALQGKVLNQQDHLGWKGMAQQSFEFKEKYGHFPKWTNSLFSGMPAYTIAMDQAHKVSVGYFHWIFTLGLPKPINFFFASCICFYFLCQVMNVRSWISILASIGFAYATYNAVIISVGHDTKMLALCWAPGMIGSFLLLLQKKYWWGLALLSIFSGLQIGTQHVQIVYYTLLILLIITICYLILAWKAKQIKHAFLSLVLAAVAGTLGFLAYAVSMIPLQEYAKETIRGGQSELTPVDKANKTKNGLDKDYAFDYSYGIGETLTLLLPNAYGGGSGGNLYSGSTNFSEKLSEVGVPEENALQMENAYSYWGDQPIQSGTVYLGAVLTFLFIFGLFYLKSWHKWWIVSAVILGIVLAWGKYFSAFNYLLFDYLPFYNKFRAPSIALVIPQIMFPLLAALTLEQLFIDQTEKGLIWKKFRLSVMVTGGLFAILTLFYFSSDFKGKNDTRIRDSFAMQLSNGNTSPEVQQQVQPLAQGLVKSLQEDRKSLYGKDLLRSLFLVALTVLVIGAYLKNKLKPLPVIIILFLLNTFDVLGVSYRYLNAETYVEPEEFSFTPTPADQQILADPNKPFRVFDNTDPNGPYSSSRAAYFHNSIGGYHPAKLEIYQDLIEKQLSKGNMQVFNMLNAKYFIVENPSNRQPVAQLNRDAFGPAWLVKGIKIVPNADEEMKALDSTPLRDTAVVQQKFQSLIKFPPQFDTSASIRLVENLNDVVKYDFNATTNQFVVFSEIYYDKGWNAYVDGKKSDYVRTNYVLRGMSMPAGKHSIEFRFEPRTVALGNTITLIASLIVYLILAIAIYLEFRKKKIST